jgi:ubiquinone/menaquinone biosynthesis C-methylase UbiE
MAAEFKVRDALKSRKNIVAEVGIKQGFNVLDFGCGPGSYILPVAELIGETGKLYALDVMPLAIEMVENLIKKNNLKNVQTILSDCKTGLSNNSLDAVLLYDAFHDLEDQEGVLNEIHRVLKADANFSFSDHHMKEADILASLTSQGLFKLLKKGKYTYSFSKV